MCITAFNAAKTLTGMRWSMQNSLKNLWQGPVCPDDGTAWQGILCFYNRVAVVRLGGMNITGETVASASWLPWKQAHCSLLSSHKHQPCGDALSFPNAGTLPASFASLSFLYLLNLHDNHLSGMQKLVLKVSSI